MRCAIAQTYGEMATAQWRTARLVLMAAACRRGGRAPLRQTADPPGWVSRRRWSRHRAVMTNRGWDTNAILGHVDPRSVTESACAGSYTQIFSTNLCGWYFLSSGVGRLYTSRSVSTRGRALRRVWPPKWTGSALHKGLWEKSACVDPAQADSVTECGSTWPKMAFVSPPRLVTTAPWRRQRQRRRWQSSWDQVYQCAILPSDGQGYLYREVILPYPAPYCYPSRQICAG